MKLAQKITTLLFGGILVLFCILALFDTQEKQYKTNFNQDNIVNHVEKLSENAERPIGSLANEKAIEYIAKTLESYGVANENVTTKPAYQIQEYVADDEKYSNWYLKNIIVNIPANAANKTNEAIMFMGHFDSVPMGDGASDDGVAIGVMLEAINYYLEEMAKGFKLSNDLVFCFVNGEEYGLYGSEAFMEEFRGFNDVTNRIKFATNLESRGTDGTLIMFETSAKNYKTIKMLAKVNKNVFTCSIATMVYDMMPNGTDFSNFKEVYQGLNFANIGGGENYHTQNDNVENIGMAYLSQQAMIVDGLIKQLSNETLDDLYGAQESAIFFSYLNITTIVYNHVASIIMGILLILLVIAKIILVIAVNHKKTIKKTLLAIVGVIINIAASAAASYILYYAISLISAMFGTINIHQIGSISYSNLAIIIGIIFVSFGITALFSKLCQKWFKIDGQDILRATSYIFAILGIVLTFVLPDASYLFVFVALLLMIYQVLMECLAKYEIEKFHVEVLILALYLPILMPIVALAASALGMTMSYAFGILGCLMAIIIVPTLPNLELLCVTNVINKLKKKEIKKNIYQASGIIMGVGVVILLIVSMIKPNASVNLQGKQNIATLPYDDALIYVADANSANYSYEYRVYDLNSYSYLADYAPKMKYNGNYYHASIERKINDFALMTTLENSKLSIVRFNTESIVYLTITNVNDTDDIVINDGKTTKTVNCNSSEVNITIHSNCVVSLPTSAKVSYKEVLRDVAELIPNDLAKNDLNLHFNYWLIKDFN